MRPVHFIFSPSGAHSLRQAMSRYGPSPEVVALFDDLSIGPLDPVSRAEWWRENFYSFEDTEDDVGDEIWRRESRFWEMASSAEVRPIVWVNRTSAQERTGLLSFIAYTRGRPFQLIDVTDINTQVSEHAMLASPVSIAALLPAAFSQILLQNDSAVVVDPDRVEAALADWKRLLKDGALLRIVDASGQITSVPEDYFDSWILRFVGEYWTKAARVVGEALDVYHRECHRRIGDLYISRRLFLLADASIVEFTGTLRTLHECSVRLPQRHTENHLGGTPDPKSTI